MTSGGRVLAVVCLLLAGMSNVGCTTTKFVYQAAKGQWALASAARPLQEVLEDPDTAERTRRLLQEVVRIKAFGIHYGLEMHSNYEKFVQLDRPYVVWFVNASAPLAFEPKTFWFPVVGSFPGLSWFDEADAREFAADLAEQGWDVNVRGVTAFSTGGWFDDPILSSMFFEHPAVIGLLANIVLHESVHATVLAPNQQYFNESLASFVAGELTPIYLKQYYGAESVELREYENAMLGGERNWARMADANTELTRIYQSPWSDELKLREKRRVLEQLAREVTFAQPPNNATLIGVQLYNEGKREMEQLREACGEWLSFLGAVDSMRTEHFGAEQSPVIGPALEELTRRGCVPFPRQPARLWANPLHQQRARRLGSH